MYQTNQHDYEEGRQIKNDVGRSGFMPMLVAVVLKADKDNLEKLARVFPEIVDETIRRYNAPGGFLPGERS